MYRALLLSIGVALPVAGLKAQTAGMPLFLDGMQVRLHVNASLAGRPAGSAIVQGLIVGVSGDSVRIRDRDGNLRSVSASDVSAVEISRGKDRGRGAARGALWGVAAGLLMTALPIDCGESGNGADCQPDGSQPTFAGYLGTNVALGIMTGAAIGAIVGRERWERYSLEGRVGLAGRGNGLGLSIAF